MRVLLFGVDGLTFRILNPLIERGLLPNFQRVRDGGVQSVLKSIVPPLTPPAWASIFTGLPSAGHGIYDFWEFERKEHSTQAHVMTHRKGGKAIWNVLSDWGKRVVIVNVPMTYPPEPVNGIMLSGYMAPDMKSNVTYPASFKDELLQAVPNYQIDISSEVQHGRIGNLFAETLQMTQERNAMLRLALSKPWDFFFIAYTGADRIQHMHWDEIIAFHPQAVAYYQLLDEALGMALDALDPEDMLMVVSDHGFQGAHRQFYIQEYLLRQGLLHVNDSRIHRRTAIINLCRAIGREVLRTVRLQGLSRWLRRQLYRKGIGTIEKDDHAARVPELDWSRTKAWTPSSSGWLGGFADIFLDESMTEEQVSELIRAFQAIRDPDTGQPLALEIHREDAFGQGTFPPGERHIVLLSNEDINLPTKLGHTSLWETTAGSRGLHHPDGVLYLYGARVKKGATIQPTHIYDVVPTILTYLDVPLHQELVGKVIEAAFEQSLSAKAGAGSNGLVGQKLKKLASRSARDGHSL